MIARPTDEVMEDAEWLEVGFVGCLIPDAYVTEDSETDDEPEN